MLAKLKLNYHHEVCNHHLLLQNKALSARSVRLELSKLNKLAVIVSLAVPVICLFYALQFLLSEQFEERLNIAAN